MTPTLGLNQSEVTEMKSVQRNAEPRGGDSARKEKG